MGAGFSTSVLAARMVGEGDGMRIRNVVAGMLLVAAGTAIAAVVAAGTPQTKAPSDPPMIDAQAFQKILAEHKGKPLLVNFWATWCEPCRDEYPMLNEL